MMIETTGIEGPVVDVVSRFRAPRDKVFDTWTKPELISKWFMAAPGYLPALAEVKLEPLGAWKIVVRPDGDAGQSVISGHFYYYPRPPSPGFLSNSWKQSSLTSWPMSDAGTLW